MTDRTMDLVADTRCEVAESLVWLNGGLIWTDITAKQLYRLDAATGEHRSWNIPRAVGCLAPTTDGDFVAATEHGFERAKIESDDHAPLTPVAPVLRGTAAMRFNDGRCDRQGRFWASSMDWKPDIATPAGTLWRLDRGEPSRMIDDLVVGNGLAWSPDGRTMYLADTHAMRRMVWAFDFDPDEGIPTHRRIFIDWRVHGGGRPDGAAIDTDGGYWIAVTDIGEVWRITPGGRIDMRITVPVSHPTMPAFGDDDLRTLYIGSLRTNRAPPDAADGGIFAIRLSQQGLLDPLYRP